MESDQIPLLQKEVIEEIGSYFAGKRETPCQIRNYYGKGIRGKLEKFHKDMEESKNSTDQRKATSASLYEEA